MRNTLRILCTLLLTALIATALSCNKPPKPPEENKGAEVKETAKLGRLMFDTPVSITDPGIVDVPRMIQAPNGNIQLVYMLTDGQSQRIMHMKSTSGQFQKPAFLSQDEGRKEGGAFLTSRTQDDFLAYWINVSVTGGQLLYKESEDSGQTFTMEKQWNERSEVRWPCVIVTASDTLAYFFVHASDKWELAANRNFSPDKEPTVDIVEGTPFRLQGLTDGAKNVWLAYFTRAEKSEGGKIAFLTSLDGGVTFDRQYLFDSKVIPSISSFFSLARSVNGRDQIIHLVYTEGTPDSTILYYSRSENGGSFSEPIALITSEEPLTRNPFLSANGKFVFVATADTDDDGPALRYLISEDGGKSFDQPSIATRNVSDPETFTGTIDSDGRVILVWDDIAVKSDSGQQLFVLKGSLRGK
jgi:hypothetical protein